MFKTKKIHLLLHALAWFSIALFILLAQSFFSVPGKSLEGRILSPDGDYSCFVDGFTVSACTRNTETAQVLHPAEDCIAAELSSQTGSRGVVFCEKNTMTFSDGLTADFWDFTFRDNQGFLGLPVNTPSLIFKENDGSGTVVQLNVAEDICGNFNETTDASCGATAFAFSEATGVAINTGSADDVDKPNQIDVDGDLPDGCTAERDADGRVSRVVCDDGTEYNFEGTKVVDKGTEVSDLNDRVDDAALAGANKQGFIGAIIEAIIDLILAIFILIVWLFGIVLQFVFWAVASGFLWLVRLNPATQGLVATAVNPWRIVIQIANVLVLGSFTFVGFGYLLNIKSIKNQMKVGDFLVNVVIIAVAINFTLAATTTFVNVLQGVGDVLFFSYVETSQKCQESKEGVVDNSSDKVICNIRQNLSEASALRCKSLSENEKCQSLNENTDALSEAEFYVGRNLTILIKESLYVLIMLYAIFIFIKAFKLALFRAVGLWLLMVTSPLALVMYLTPISQLKKYANQWLHLFWSMALFYPAFVFGLIIIDEMAKGFGNAVKQISEQRFVGTLGGDVTANALLSEQDSIRIILALLTAIVSIGVLQVLVGFFEDSFGKIASSFLNGVTGVVGGGLRAAGAAGLATATGVSALRNRFDRTGRKRIATLRKGEKTLKKDLKNATTQADKDRIQARLKKVQGLKQKAINQRSAKLQGKTAQRTKLFANARKKLNDTADWVEATPDLLESIGNVPQGYLSNLGKVRQARVAKKKEQFMGKFERYVRGNKYLSNGLATTGYVMDADPNFNRFAGLNADDMKAIQQEYRDKKKDPKARYFKDEINKRASDIYKKTAGIKDTYDREVKDLLWENLAKKIAENGGDINALDEKDRSLARTLFKQSKDDVGLLGKVLNNKGLTELVRDQFDQLDPESVEAIQEQAPALLSSQKERELAGLRVKLSPDAAKKALPGNFQDPDFARGWKNADGASVESLDELNKKANINGISPVTDTSIVYDPEVQTFKNRLDNSATGANPEDIQAKKGSLNELYEANATQLVAKGYAPGKDLVTEISKIKADESLSDPQKQSAIKDAWTNADDRFFGAGVITDGKDFNPGTLESLNYAALAATGAGKDMLKGGLGAKDAAGNDIYTEDEKAAAIRAGIARGAKNNLIQRDGTFGANLEATTDAFAKAIKQSQAASVGYNTSVKALDDLAGRNNLVEEIVNPTGPKQNIYRNFGMNKELENMEDDLMSRGEIQIGGQTYNFKNLGGSERGRLMGNIRRAVAGEVGGKEDAVAVNELDSSGGEAQRLLTEQIRSGGRGMSDLGTDLNQKIIDRGRENVEQLVEDTRRDMPADPVVKAYDLNTISDPAVRGSLLNDIEQAAIARNTGSINAAAEANIRSSGEQEAIKLLDEQIANGNLNYSDLYQNLGILRSSGKIDVSREKLPPSNADYAKKIREESKKLKEKGKKAGDKVFDKTRKTSLGNVDNIQRNIGKNSYDDANTFGGDVLMALGGGSEEDATFLPVPDNGGIPPLDSGDSLGGGGTLPLRGVREGQARLSQPVILTDTSGNKQNATFEQVIRDYNKPEAERVFAYDDTLVKMNQLHKYAIDNQGQIYHTGRDAAYELGNYTLDAQGARDKSTQELVDAVGGDDLLRQSGIDPANQSQLQGDTSTNAQPGVLPFGVNFSEEQLANMPANLRSRMQNLRQIPSPSTQNIPQADQQKSQKTQPVIPIAAAMNNQPRTVESRSNQQRQQETISEQGRLDNFQQTQAVKSGRINLQDLESEVVENIKQGGALSSGQAKELAGNAETQYFASLENTNQAKANLDQLTARLVPQIENNTLSNSQKRSLKQAEREYNEAKVKSDQQRVAYDTAQTRYEEIESARQQRRDQELSGTQTVAPQLTKQQERVRDFEYNERVKETKSRVKGGTYQAQKFANLNERQQHAIVGGPKQSIGKSNQVQREIQGLQSQAEAARTTINSLESFQGPLTQAQQADLQDARNNYQQLNEQIQQKNSQRQQLDHGRINRLEQHQENQRENFKAATTTNPNQVSQMKPDTPEANAQAYQAVRTRYEAAKQNLQNNRFEGSAREFTQNATDSQKQAKVEFDKARDNLKAARQGRDQLVPGQSAKPIEELQIPNVTESSYYVGNKFQGQDRTATGGYTRITQEQAQANVQRYQEQASKNKQMQSFEKLSPQQQQAIASGKMQSIGQAQKQLNDSKQVVEGYKQTAQQIQDLGQASRQKIDQARQTKNLPNNIPGLRGQNARNQQQRKQTLRSAIEDQQAVQNVVNQNPSQPPIIDSTAQQQIEANNRIAAENSQKAQNNLEMMERASQTNKDSMYYQRASGRASHHQSVTQQQNQSLINTLDEKITAKEQELAARRGNRNTQSSTSQASIQDTPRQPINRTARDGNPQITSQSNYDYQNNYTSQITSKPQDNKNNGSKRGPKDDDLDGGMPVVPSSPQPKNPSGNSGGGISSRVSSTTNNQINRGESQNPSSISPNYPQSQASGGYSTISSQSSTIAQSYANKESTQTDVEENARPYSINSVSKQVPQQPAPTANVPASTRDPSVSSTSDNVATSSQPANQIPVTMSSDIKTNLPQQQFTPPARPQGISQDVNTSNRPQVSSSPISSDTLQDQQTQQNIDQGVRNAQAIPEVGVSQREIASNITSRIGSQSPSQNPEVLRVPKQNPKTPITAPSQNASFQDTKRFYESAPVQELRSYKSDFDTVQGIIKQGFTEDQARQIEFAQKYVQIENDRMNIVNNEVFEKLNKLDNTGESGKDFKKLLKKSKTEGQKMRSEELLRLSNYISNLTKD